MNYLLAVLIFLLLPLSFFALFSWAILYHLLRFGFHKSSSRRMALVYSLGMLGLALFTCVNFLSVDWKEASLTDFLEKSNLYLFTETYDRR